MDVNGCGCDWWRSILLLVVVGMWLDLIGLFWVSGFCGGGGSLGVLATGLCMFSVIFWVNIILMCRIEEYKMRCRLTIC